MTNRQKQAIATKTRIYECASQLFAENGFEAVTVTDICKAANVAVGVFYYYFPSKDVVIDESYEYFHNNLEIEISEFAGTDPVDRIRHILKISNRHHQNRGITYMTLFLRNELAKKHYYRRTPRNMVGFIHDAVVQAVSEGRLFGDVETITNDIYKTSRGVVYDWVVKNDGASLEKESVRLLEIVLAYYSKPQ